MQHCGFCKGLLQNTPVFKHQVKKPELLREDSTDVRSIITKCGHTFHYVCLVRDKFQESGLVDCFACHKRTRLSDAIIVDSSSEATDSGDTAAQASGVKRTSLSNSAQQKNKQSFDGKRNFNQSDIFPPSGINPSHIFKTIALGMLLALIFVYVSGGSLESSSVDVGGNFQGLLDSSFLRFKKTVAVMSDLKTESYKVNYQGDGLWDWETLKEEFSEHFHHHKRAFVFLAKRSWKNTGKTIRKFKRYSKSTLNQLTPKFKKVYKSTMHKIRTFFGDNNRSRYKGATFLPNDSEDSTDWDSAYWSDFVKIINGLKLEGIFHGFDEVRRVISSEAAGLLPEFKKHLNTLKYKMFGGMSNIWASYHSKFDSSSEDSSNYSSPPKEEFKSWVKGKTSSANMVFTKLLFSFGKSAANFKKDAKPWLDKKAKSANKNFAKMSANVDETASEVKETIEKWYEKIYLSIKSKIAEFAT